MAISVTAGSLTVSSVAIPGSESIEVWTLAWTSHASAGTVTATGISGIEGKILRVVTNPGSVAPTDNYDITLSDIDGLDIFEGLGANRDTANSEEFVPYISTYGQVVTQDDLSLAITNAGNSKTGAIKIYLEKTK